MCIRDRIVAFAVFFLIVLFLSIIRPGCRFGIEKPLRALVFLRMVEIFESIEKKESRKAEYEGKLTGSDSLT